jgi:hypothetical protein
LRGEILREGAANTGTFLRCVRATDRLPMLFGTMLSNIRKRPKSASTNLAIRFSQTHFIAGNVAFFRLLAQNPARRIGPVAEVNMSGRQGPQRRRHLSPSQ